jgi:hypothetical protein
MGLNLELNKITASIKPKYGHSRCIDLELNVGSLSLLLHFRQNGQVVSQPAVGSDFGSSSSSKIASNSKDDYDKIMRVLVYLWDNILNAPCFGIQRLIAA